MRQALRMSRARRTDPIVADYCMIWRRERDHFLQLTTNQPVENQSHRERLASTPGLIEHCRGEPRLPSSLGDPTGITKLIYYVHGWDEVVLGRRYVHCLSRQGMGFKRKGQLLARPHGPMGGERAQTNRSQRFGNSDGFESLGRLGLGLMAYATIV